MEMGNLLVSFFIVVIILAIISILSTGSQTGQFIMITKILEPGILLILLSIFVIFVIKVPKKYYRPIPCF